MKKSRGSSVRGERAEKKDRGIKSTKINLSDIPAPSEAQLLCVRRVGLPAVDDVPRMPTAIRLDRKS